MYMVWVFSWSISGAEFLMHSTRVGNLGIMTIEPIKRVCTAKRILERRGIQTDGFV